MKMKRFLSLLVVLWLLPSTSVMRGETTWNLVTDVSNLSVGDQIIIASKEYEYALSIYQNANNRSAKVVNYIDNQCIITDEVQVLTLQTGKISNTFAFYTGEGYLYAASNSSNYLRTKTTLDENGSWMLTIDSQGVATICSQGDNTHNTILYNNIYKIFSCYQPELGNICVYKKSITNYHTITYIENGSISQQQYATGSEVTLKSPTEINGFVCKGWTSTAMDIPSDTPPSDLKTSHTLTEDVTFYAVYAIENSGDFEKVDTDLSNYTGTYLIVNEENDIIFDGSLDDIDVAYNIFDAYAHDGTISSNARIDAMTFAVEQVSDGYSIRSASGKYIGRTANSPGLNSSTTTVYVNTIYIDDEGNAVVTASNSMTLRYNQTEGQCRFRYYSGTQQPIQLYKKGASITYCYCTSVNVINVPMTITENTTWTAPTSVCNTLTISNNAILTAPFLGNKIASNIVVEEGAGIDCNKGVFGTYNLNVAAASQWGDGISASDGWYGISSPIAGGIVTNSVSGLITDGSNDYDLYVYSEPDFAWHNSKKESNRLTRMTMGTGCLYASKEGTTISFSGEFNTANLYKTLSYSSKNQSLKGFNLIGNPFAKSITLSSVEGADMNGFYLITNDGAWEAHIGTADVIKPCEAFLVQTSSEAQICINKNVVPTKNDVKNNNFIAIKVTNSQYEDVAYARFFSSPNDTTEMSKMPHQNVAIHSVSINNKAIASFSDDTKEFDVSFKTVTTGIYKISLKASDFFKIGYLHLIDKQTGADIDMVVEENYEFIGSPADNEERFVVRISNENDDENENINNWLYVNDNQLITKESGSMQIFDVTGRIVISETFCDGHIDISGLKNATYIVRLVNDNGVKTQKIIVR